MSVAAAVVCFKRLELAGAAKSDVERINFDPRASANLPRISVTHEHFWKSLISRVSCA